MRYLADERLYTDTGYCLRYLREAPPPAVSRWSEPELYHVYWSGRFTRKVALAIKSFLATQDLSRSELWLWLDGLDPGRGERDPLLAPLLPFITVKRFDAAAEARDTPLERRTDLYESARKVVRSDFHRLVTLFRHGGVYVDADTLFLRDLRELPLPEELPAEFCSRWSGRPWVNTALTRLERESAVGLWLLSRADAQNSCRPQELTRAAEGEELDVDLLVLPSGLFDPLWLHVDRVDVFADRPFDSFPDFFRPFGWRFRRKPEIRSYRDLFPGAFAYHWHNLWQARERASSYFGLVEAELDAELRERIGMDA
jgi:hypothetical protein